MLSSHIVNPPKRNYKLTVVPVAEDEDVIIITGGQIAAMLGEISAKSNLVPSTSAIIDPCVTYSLV